jgi:molecular chaperone DnaK (HSP70)
MSNENLKFPSKKLIPPIQNEQIIGIDLGTTFSCVGLYRNNNVEIIKNTLGENITPSVVFIGENEHFVGQKAINFQLKNQSNTIYDTKRLIGKKYNDKNVQEEIKHLLYKVIENKETGEPMIEINKTNGYEKNWITDGLHDGDGCLHRKR